MTKYIYGNLDDDKYWHQQTKPDTCAIAAQEFILNAVTGQHLSEEQLTQKAEKKGWYRVEGITGTLTYDVGKLLEAHGIPVQRSENHYNYNLKQPVDIMEKRLLDLMEKLEQGEKVLVVVNSDEIWNQQDTPLNETRGMPGQRADHAVQVIAISFEDSDPHNSTVILNDSGIPDGEGFRVSAEQFLNAWEDSNFYMVSTIGAKDYKKLSDFSDTNIPNDRIRQTDFIGDFTPELKQAQEAKGNFQGYSGQERSSPQQQQSTISENFPEGESERANPQKLEAPRGQYGKNKTDHNFKPDKLEELYHKLNKLKELGQKYSEKAQSELPQQNDPTETGDGTNI
jgi:hypothetical protein